MIKSILSFLFLLIISFHIQGTHIIGGNISYTYLGNNEYEIHLTVYRDCLNGVPPFDSPASIGIYHDTTLYGTLSVMPDDSSEIFVQGNCIPGNICITKANYYVTVTLPVVPAPYTIVYQRCCRSGSVLNLVDPLNTGMSFFCEINTNNPNSSPVFNHEFAAFTYINDNFSFDASAVDPDGDVLVYSLDDAHEGASQIDPMPDPPAPPPYNTIPWQVPYTLNNMISGSSPLTIDTNTGIMTATPGTVGLFEVCLKVEEYRNGNLINVSRKEFVLAVNPGVYYDLSGSVNVDNGSVALDIGKAWLIRLNLLDSTLTATDTNLVSNGNYLHPGAINGVYLAKASADSSSPYYANNLPTYYGNVLYWYDATSIEICTSNFSTANIDLIQGVNPGGPGFVGGLISQGANRLNSASTLSMANITVILMDSQNQPVAYDVTDANGYFEIGNFPLGTYKLFIDRLNYYVDNSIAPSVTLTSSSPTLTNQAFLLHNTWLEYVGTVGTNELNSNNVSMSVYPNPASADFSISISTQQAAMVKISVENIYGSRVWANEYSFSNGKNQEIQIDSEKLNFGQGIYIIQASGIFGTITKKLIISGPAK